MPTPIKWGSEFLINTTTPDSQSGAVVTALADGRFVVTWQDESAGDFDIRAQIFNADGSKSGNEFIAHTNATDFNVAPVVTAVQSGGFVIAWQDNTTFGAGAQVFDVVGDPAGAVLSINSALLPQITALANGNFVVVIEDSTNGDIQAQVYNAGGSAVGNAIPVNTTTLGTQSQPSIAALADGGFVVVWTDPSANELGDLVTGLDVRAQRYDEDGFPVGNEFVVNTTTGGDQDSPTVVGLADGRFVVAWQAGGADVEIVAQIFNSDGTKVGDDFLVHTTTGDDQRDVSLTALADGRFVVTWTDYSQTGGDTSGVAVRAQVFNADGTTSGDEFLVNTTTSQGQGFPTVTALADGRLVFAWSDASQTGGDTDGNAIRGQIFDPRGDAVTLFGTGLDDSLVGTFLNDFIGGRSGNDDLYGENGQDTLRGENGNDTLHGGLNNDLLDGGAGNDFLLGDSGSDTLLGGAGNDLLVGGVGADLMMGGTGNDTYSLDHALDGIIEGAGQGIDTIMTDAFSVNLANYANVENVLLSGPGDFSLIGSSARNMLHGNEGDNLIRGGREADKLVGYDGADSFVYGALRDSTVKPSGRDTILDFDRTEGDKIDLSSLDARTGSGNQAFKWIAKQGFHDKKGELHYVVKQGDAYVEGDVNGDGKADFAIRVDDVTSLLRADFLL